MPGGVGGGGLVPGGGLGIGGLGAGMMIKKTCRHLFMYYSGLSSRITGMNPS